MLPHSLTFVLNPLERGVEKCSRKQMYVCGLYASLSGLKASQE